MHVALKINRVYRAEAQEPQAAKPNSDAIRLVWTTPGVHDDELVELTFVMRGNTEQLRHSARDIGELLMQALKAQAEEHSDVEVVDATGLGVDG